MTDRSLSRRTVLKTGAGAVAAGVTASLAGCSAIPGFGDDGNQGSKEIQDWAFEPGEIGNQDSYRARYQNYGSIRDNEDEFDSEYFDRVESQYESRYGDRLDIDFEDADWQVRLGQAQVLSADHTVEDVVDHLEDEFDYEEDDDDVDGYTTIVGPNERDGYAADGSTVLHVRVSEDVADALEDLIATQNGDIDMWADEEEDFSEAVTNVSGDVASAGIGGFAEDVVASGSSATFDGETTQQQFVRVYEEEDDIDKEEIREAVEDEDDASVSFNGRVVVFEGETDTDEYGVA